MQRGWLTTNGWWTRDGAGRKKWKPALRGDTNPQNQGPKKKGKGHTVVKIHKRKKAVAYRTGILNGTNGKGGLMGGLKRKLGPGKKRPVEKLRPPPRAGDRAQEASTDHPFEDDHQKKRVGKTRHWGAHKRNGHKKRKRRFGPPIRRHRPIRPPSPRPGSRKPPHLCKTGTIGSTWGEKTNDRDSALNHQSNSGEPTRLVKHVKQKVRGLKGRKG